MSRRNRKIAAAYQHRPNVHIDYTQPIRPYHRRVAALVARYGPDGGTVLDIGCGVGHTLVEVRKRRPDLRLIAADIDDNLLAVVRSRDSRLAETWKLSSVEDVAASDDRYDVLIMSHVLEHMSRPLDALKGLVRRLTPGGVLILAVPNPVRIQVVLGNLFKHHYVNRGHVYAWDRSHWINFLENIARVNVLEYTQDHFPVPIVGRFMRPIEGRLANVFPWFASSHIAVVQAGDSERMELRDIEKRVRRAIDVLYARDGVLLGNTRAEWSVAHRLAVYIEDQFQGWHVDCESHRQGPNGDNKRRDECGAVRPDIIVHRRGRAEREHNLLALELKRRAFDEGFAKVREYPAPPTEERKYQFQFGLTILLGKEPELTWFQDGQECTDAAGGNDAGHRPRSPGASGSDASVVPIRSPAPHVASP